MTIKTKYYDINKSWILVAQNTTSFAIFANLYQSVDLFIGTAEPVDGTSDYITIDPTEYFSISKLVDNTDRVYIRSNGSPISVRIVIS